jgi:hypothetical protein
MALHHNPRIVTDGLVLHLDAANTKSYKTLDTTTGWRLPSSMHIKGVLSSDTRTWSSEPEAQGGYSSVVLNKTFQPYENFEVIAYWARNYRGIAMIYGSNVSHEDFTGWASDSHGPYMGSLSNSGFPSGYSASYYGQYHSPIGGGGAATTGYWFKWARIGNVLSIQYSATSATGPWTNVEADGSCASTDKVIVGAGEASSTEVSDLEIISIINYSTYDLSGNGNGGTLVNGVSYDSDNGGSLAFDGTDDYIDCGEELPILTNYTISLVAYINEKGGLFSRSLGGSWTDERLVLHQYGVDTLTLCHSDGSTYSNTNSTSDLPLEEWVFIDVSWDGAYARFYFNGSLDVSQGFTHSTTNSGVKTWIGKVEGLTPNQFNGKIACAKIYNRALSATEVLQNYNALKGRF